MESGRSSSDPEENERQRQFQRSLEAQWAAAAGYEVKVEFGAWLLDQFDPVRHRPLVELIQLFVVAAWVLLWINKAADSRVEASKPQVRP